MTAKTMTTLPESIPTQIQHQLEQVQQLRQNCPELFREGVSLFFGESRLTLTLPVFSSTEAEMQAVALRYPDAGWKPKAAPGHGPYIDWHGEIHGVQIILPRVETLGMVKLPPLVDLSRYAVNSETKPTND